MRRKAGKGLRKEVLFCLLLTLLWGSAFTAEAKPQLSEARLSLVKGETRTLKVSGASGKIRWKSSDPRVVSVDSSGKIQAKKKGSATVSAKTGGKKLSCKVLVANNRWNQLFNEYRDDDGTNQLLMVKYKGGSSAKVQLYQKTDGKWYRALSCRGYVGRNGIGKAREGDGKTPTGVFCLTQAFGIKADPGAQVSYVKVDRNLYWCGDEPYYNQLIDIREHPHSCRGEHLIDYVPQYNYGMFLDYNSEHTYGKGSAIFLHCMGPNSYTAGCIAVSEENMIRILRTVEDGAKICIFPK